MSAVVADNYLVLTDGALALALDLDDWDTAPAAAVLRPENRVNAIRAEDREGTRENVLQFPYWRLENDSVYDRSRRQILNYLRARYYDPTTAQFLSVDPMVAKTRSPYAYVAGNPLNRVDPTGLWPWDNLCVRNPFGGDNDNGGCHTTLSTTQGALAIGAVSVIASGGALAAPEGAAATALGVTGIVTGGAASVADWGPCQQGNTEACLGLGLGAFGAGGGVVSMFFGGSTAIGAFLGGASFVAGGAGFAADLGYYLSGLGDANPCKA